jgi:hypothetical protein
MNQELLAKRPAVALSFNVGRAAVVGSAAKRLSAFAFELIDGAVGVWGVRTTFATLLGSDTPKSPSLGANQTKPAVTTTPATKAS